MLFRKPQQSKKFLYLDNINEFFLLNIIQKVGFKLTIKCQLNGIKLDLFPEYLF